MTSDITKQSAEGAISFCDEGLATQYPKVAEAHIRGLAHLLLAAPQPDTVEPVGEVAEINGCPIVYWDKSLPVGTKFYTRPPAQPDTVAVERVASFEEWSKRLRNQVFCTFSDDKPCRLTTEALLYVIAEYEKYRALLDEGRVPLDQEKPDPLMACTHPDCGRFYDHNAGRMACRAWSDNACALDQEK